MVPLPRLPINTGESTDARGTIFFLRKRGTNRGGKILEKNRKQRRENRKQGGEFI
jgi:hypothetical protein